MGGVVGGGGKSGSSSSDASNVDLGGIANAMEGLATQDVGLSGAQQNIAGIDTGYGVNILGPAYQQFAAGATGGLTPAQQALVTEALGQSNLGTNANYANLGLGGSTMEQQDLNANQLRSVALQSGLADDSEKMGLAALQEGLGFMGAGSGALGGAGSALSNAGALLGGAGSLGQTGQANKANELQSLMAGVGGSSTGGSGSSGFGNIISSFLGGGSSAGGSAMGTTSLDSLLGSMYGSGSSSTIDETAVNALLSGA